MNLLHANLNRLDVARRDLRDLKGLGPLVASSLRSDATAQGPRPFKSRRSLRATSNLYLVHSCHKSCILIGAGSLFCIYSEPDPT